VKLCSKCKHEALSVYMEPCFTCFRMGNECMWEPKEEEK